MIHPRCARYGHSWGPWSARLSYDDGSPVAVTPGGDYTPNGPEPVHRYRRECQVMGCDAVTIACDLAPLGGSRVLDRGGSEALFHLPPRRIP